MIAAISHASSALIIAVVFLFAIFTVILGIMLDREHEADDQHHRRLLEELKRQPVGENVWGDE